MLRKASFQMLMLLFLQCYKLTSTPAKIKQEEKEKTRNKNVETLKKCKNGTFTCAYKLYTDT